jgi:fructose-1,6-bisphosphatase I
LGEFLLSHENIKMPDRPKYFSVNQGYSNMWTPSLQKYVLWLQGREGTQTSLSERYIGSLVADFHRNLLEGGVFFYPSRSERPQGKLRLLYEAAPLAFLAKQAGGYASDGHRDILEVVPESLHQRIPLFIGDKRLVEKAEELLRQEGSLH